MARYLFGSGSLRKAPQMIVTAVAAGLALGVGFGGAAMAQSLRFPLMPDATRALLVDHDKGKHEHGKNKHRERDDEGDDEDRGRGRRSSTYGSWRDYAPMPTYYYPPPATYYPPPTSSYAAPYAPYAPTVPPASARPSARVGTQPAAPTASSSEPSRSRDAAGSSGPSIQWVDPPPAR
jgi:hypothetical protein